MLLLNRGQGVHQNHYHISSRGSWISILYALNLTISGQDILLWAKLIDQFLGLSPSQHEIQWYTPDCAAIRKKDSVQNLVLRVNTYPTKLSENQRTGIQNWESWSLPFMGPMITIRSIDKICQGKASCVQFLSHCRIFGTEGQNGYLSDLKTRTRQMRVGGVFSALHKMSAWV